MLNFLLLISSIDSMNVAYINTVNESIQLIFRTQFCCKTAEIQQFISSETIVNERAHTPATVGWNRRCRFTWLQTGAATLIESEQNEDLKFRNNDL